MGTGAERKQADCAGKWLVNGQAALARGQMSEAIESFRHALEADSDLIDAYCSLGIALAMDAQVYEAIDTFEAALARSPNNFMVHFKLAELYFRLWVPEKGRQHLHAAVEASATPQERQLVRTLMSQEADREKRRISRPTFGKA